MTSTTVHEPWRYPVKSMGGQRVPEVRVDRRGVHADRLWAVRDLENDITASARRVPALLGCWRPLCRRTGPGRGTGNAPTVMITFADGSESSGADSDIHNRISEVVGREVRLTALLPLADSSQHRLSVIGAPHPQ